MLYRDEGAWRESQIVSATWVHDSVRRGGYSPEEWRLSDQSPVFWNYGYQWWLADRERGDYLSVGKGGQFIYVDPKNDIVAVRLGYTLGQHRGMPLTTADWVVVLQAVAQKIASP